MGAGEERGDRRGIKKETQKLQCDRSQERRWRVSTVWDDLRAVKRQTAGIRPTLGNSSLEVWS